MSRTRVIPFTETKEKPEIKANKQISPQAKKVLDINSRLKEGETYLAALRKEKASLKVISRATGINQSRYEAIEKGLDEPSEEEANAIDKALDSPIGLLNYLRKVTVVGVADVQPVSVTKDPFQKIKLPVEVEPISLPEDAYSVSEEGLKDRPIAVLSPFSVSPPEAQDSINPN